MTKCYVIAFALCLTGTFAFGQDFTVMSLKGKAEYQESPGRSDSKWLPVHVGDAFRERDVLRTSFASYVKLLHKDGRLLSVDENSQVKLGDMLVARIASSPGEATSSLLAYAARQVRATRKEGGRSNVFGAVRAEMSYFTPALPAEAVLTPDPTFRWVDTDTCSAYTLYLYDQMLNVRYQGPLSGREAPWPSSVVSDRKGGTYYWRLRRSYDGAVTPPRRFVMLPADSIAFIRSELDKLDAELQNMHADEVMQHLIRAIYLEKQELYTDAFNEYTACVTLAPDNQEYREMALRMLEHVQLLEESMYLLQ